MDAMDHFRENHGRIDTALYPKAQVDKAISDVEIGRQILDEYSLFT